MCHAVSVSSLRCVYVVGGGVAGYLLPAAAARRPAVASGVCDANIMSPAAAIGGFTGTFNHYPVLRRHKKII